MQNEQRNKTKSMFQAPLWFVGKLIILKDIFALPSTDTKMQKMNLENKQGNNFV